MLCNVISDSSQRQTEKAASDIGHLRLRLRDTPPVRLFGREGVAAERVSFESTVGLKIPTSLSRQVSGNGLGGVVVASAALVGVHPCECFDVVSYAGSDCR